MNKHIGAHMSHCFQGEYQHTCKYGDDENCPAKKLEKPFTKKIEIEESAIDTLRDMVQKLQDDNAKMMQMAHNLCVSVNSVAYCYDKRPENFAFALLQATDEAGELDSLISKRTTEPKVMA